MPSEPLPNSVLTFIRNHIQSVAQIEILALVQGSPDRCWTARAVDEMLRSNEQSVARRLAEFAHAGVLAEVGDSEPTYRYQPRSEELAASASETVQMYRTRPVLVIETIFKHDDSAQSFADAFRIRPR